MSRLSRFGMIREKRERGNTAPGAIRGFFLVCILDQAGGRFLLLGVCVERPAKEPPTIALIRQFN